MADYVVESRQTLTHAGSHLTTGHDVEELLSHISEGYKKTKANQILRLLKDQDKLNVQFSECELLKEYDQIKEDKNARDSDTLSDDSSKGSDYAPSDVHRPMPRSRRCKTSMGFHKKEQSHVGLDSDSDSTNMGDPGVYMNDTRFNRPKSSYVRRRHFRKAVEVEMDVVNNTEEEFRAPVQQRVVRSARPKSRLGRSSIPESERVKRKIVLTEAVVNVPDEPVPVPKEENDACNTYDRFANTRCPVNRSRREKGKVRGFCDEDGVIETHKQSVENMSVGTSNSMDIREEITEIQPMNTNSKPSVQSQMLANFQNSGITSHSPTYVHPPPHNSPVGNVSRKDSLRGHGQMDQSPRYVNGQRDQSPRHVNGQRDQSPRYTHGQRDKSPRYTHGQRDQSPGYSHATQEPVPLRKENLWQDQSRHERYEQLRQETIRQEPLRQEPINQEPMRQEQMRQEQVRQEQMRQEQVRQEQMRQEQMRQEQVHHEQLRQEQVRQEQMHHEQLRQEQMRQEQMLQEQLRQDQLRQEALRHEQLRHDQLRHEPVHPEPLRTEPHADYSQSRHDSNIHNHGIRSDGGGRPTANDIISQNLRPDSNSRYYRPKNPEPIQSRPMGRPEIRQNNRRRFQRRYMQQAPSNPHVSNVRPTSESVILARQKTEKNLLKAQQEDNRPKSEKIIINTANKTMLSVSSNPAQGPATSVTSKSGVTQASHIQGGGYRGYDPGASRTHELQSELTLPRRQAPNNVLLGARQPLTLMKLPSLEASLAAKKKERALQIAARETCV